MKNYTLFRDSQNREALIDLTSVVGLVSTSNPKYTSIYLQGHTAAIIVDMPLAQVRERMQSEHQKSIDKIKHELEPVKREYAKKQKANDESAGHASASLGAF